MSDIVNEYFHRFYPPVIDPQKLRYSMVGFEYEDRTTRTIFPAMECADGFKMSVQGHWGAYSQPRDDFADHYAKVEVMVFGGTEPLFDAERSAEVYDGDAIYGYIPVSVVAAVIEKHGGLLVAPAPLPQGTGTPPPQRACE